MKKKIIVFLMLLALPVLVLGAFQPATLTNGVNKVAVYTQEQANKYFGLGYVLDSNFGGNSLLHNFAETFLAGFGGKVLATSTSATSVTLKEKDLAPYTAIEVIPTTGNLTYTLPATSTLTSILKNIGDTRTWRWENASTSAAVSVTIAAGTGWNLSGVDANVDVFPGAAYNNRELITMDCYRQANKDINCELRENIAAD